ncbi:MAG: tetratricopeptide repeat protein [Spirochaetales bacterium]|jgi:tetratricopeptide (TPR) repeat protein|nr:tetratricopeptide repeat protein [Spirochaetales bacterium]
MTNKAAGSGSGKNQNLAEKVSALLSGKWVVFLAILGGIVVVIALLGISYSLSQNKIRRSAQALETLERLYQDEWQPSLYRTETGGLEDAEVEPGNGEVEPGDAEVPPPDNPPPEQPLGNPEIKAEVIAKAEEILTGYPRSYAAEKARMLLGDLYTAAGEWDRAAENYALLAEAFPGSFLSPPALFRAAAAYEKLEQWEDALGCYQKIIDLYGDQIYESLRAGFNVGRLSEKLGKLDEALTAYDWIVQTGSVGSPYVNLAETRLLLLENP